MGKIIELNGRFSILRFDCRRVRGTYKQTLILEHTSSDKIKVIPFLLDDHATQQVVKFSKPGPTGIYRYIPQNQRLYSLWNQFLGGFHVKIVKIQEGKPQRSIRKKAIWLFG